MQQSPMLSLLAALLLMPAAAAANEPSETIRSARYAEPVERYGHFALGKPHEYARLNVTGSSGKSYEFALPDDEVFEDLSPRLVKMTADGDTELLVIISNKRSGARMALIRLQAGRLEIAAQSAAIGQPNRWLNPVGVSDLDADGQAEIAAVITPHLGGTLKIYRRKAAELVEVATLGGFSNHIYGSPELGMSLPFNYQGKAVLIVPDAIRQNLRIVALDNQTLREIAHCTFNVPINGAVTRRTNDSLSVSTFSSRKIVNLSACQKISP